MMHVSCQCIAINGHFVCIHAENEQTAALLTWYPPHSQESSKMQSSVAGSLGWEGRNVLRPQMGYGRGLPGTLTLLTMSPAHHLHKKKRKTQIYMRVKSNILILRYITMKNVKHNTPLYFENNKLSRTESL